MNAVAAAHGSMQLKVWLRLHWTDTRLSWDPQRYGGLTTTYFDANDMLSASEIWVPDVQPYNAIHGSATTLDTAMAKVTCVLRRADKP